MRDTINLPVAIPVWTLVSLVGSAVFTAGTLYSQMGTLIESGKKADERARAADERITLRSEKQGGALTALANTQQRVQDHEVRIGNIEHALLERSKR